VSFTGLLGVTTAYEPRRSFPPHLPSRLTLSAISRSFPAAPARKAVSRYLPRLLLPQRSSIGMATDRSTGSFWGQAMPPDTAPRSVGLLLAEMAPGQTGPKPTQGNHLCTGHAPPPTLRAGRPVRTVRCHCGCRRAVTAALRRRCSRSHRARSTREPSRRRDDAFRHLRPRATRDR
jgi:hypothetical protein